MNSERTAVPGQVRDDLAAHCTLLRDAAQADTIGGVRPAFVASPSSTQEASALMRAAAGHDLAVVPRGAGLGMDWGVSPTRCDLVVDTGQLTGVVEHTSGDLVARVRAGTTVGQLAEVVAAAGQRLALDVPAGTTVGGLIAAGLPGPRVFRYGAARDLLLGITIVRADGVVARSGGKVVKNVAGYDLGKLFAGSQGTLGLITEATFRLHPLPQAVTYLTAEGTVDDVTQAVQAAANSPVLPSAVELDWPDVAGPLRVGVLLEGTPEGVADRAKTALLASGAAQADTPPDWWGRLPGVAAEGAVIRVAFWLSELSGVLRALATAAGDAGVELDRGRACRGPGVLYGRIPAGTDHAAVVRFLHGVRRAGPPQVPPRVSTTVLTAEGGLDAYGSLPGAALMHAVKDRFDPGGRMFPGRLPEGI